MKGHARFYNYCFILWSVCSLYWVSVFSVQADEIKMTFSVSAPPYSFDETGTGIEIDIIREALAVHGHTLTPIFVPAKRILFDFKLGEVDAASKDQAQELGDYKGYFGDTYVQLHDVMFSLEEKNIDIKEPSDLKGLRVVAFQTASDHYKNWLGGLKEDPNYSETVDQSLQVKMLHRGRADVIVADRNIIAYLTKLEEEQGAIPLKPTKITDFSEPWGYRPIFRSEKLRDEFNDGLREVISSGRRQEIIENYLN